MKVKRLIMTLTVFISLCTAMAVYIKSKPSAADYKLADIEALSEDEIGPKVETKRKKIWEERYPNPKTGPNVDTFYEIECIGTGPIDCFPESGLYKENDPFEI